MDKTPLIDAKTGAERPKIETHFARIIVSWGIDNPYYSILYYDPADDEFHQGFGSRCLDNVIKWLSEEFEIIGGVFWCEPVRHGRWIETQEPISWCEDDVEVNYECSECKESNFVEWTYCPHCGAKMDGGAKGNA